MSNSIENKKHVDKEVRIAEISENKRAELREDKYRGSKIWEYNSKALGLLVMAFAPVAAATYVSLETDITGNELFSPGLIAVAITATFLYYANRQHNIADDHKNGAVAYNSERFKDCPDGVDRKGYAFKAIGISNTELETMNISSREEVSKKNNLEL